MDIQYYLEETEVQKACFKQYSSCCHQWIEVLSAYKDVFTNCNCVLKLVYVPPLNDVQAFYEEDHPLLDLLCEGLKKPTHKETAKKTGKSTVAA